MEVIENRSYWINQGAISQIGGSILPTFHPVEKVIMVPFITW